MSVAGAAVYDTVAPSVEAVAPARFTSAKTASGTTCRCSCRRRRVERSSRRSSRSGRRRSSHRGRSARAGRSLVSREANAAGVAHRAGSQRRRRSCRCPRSSERRAVGDPAAQCPPAVGDRPDEVVAERLLQPPVQRGSCHVTGRRAGGQPGGDDAGDGEEVVDEVRNERRGLGFRGRARSRMTPMRVVRSAPALGEAYLISTLRHPLARRQFYG